jgi:hypothetical protein
MTNTKYSFIIYTILQDPTISTRLSSASLHSFEFMSGGKGWTSVESPLFFVSQLQFPGSSTEHTVA